MTGITAVPGRWPYADFVTAMMAFFMLMWLLNATTEKQRKGLADFFSPTAPINRVSGGGDGAFGGDSVFTEQTLSQNGTGASLTHPTLKSQATGDGKTPDPSRGERSSDEDEALREVEEALLGSSGEVMATENPLKHVITRVTDEGLVVELFDTADATLFDPETEAPTPLLEDLLAMLGRVFPLVTNGIAVAGHTSSVPLVTANNPSWDLSLARAKLARTMMEQTGLKADRFKRVVGKADRDHATKNPMEPRNNRLVVTLIRSDL